MSVKETILSIVNSGKLFVPVSEEEEYAMWTLAKDMVCEAEYELLSNGYNEHVERARYMFAWYVERIEQFSMSNTHWCDLSGMLCVWQHGFTQEVQ